MRRSRLPLAVVLAALAIAPDVHASPSARLAYARSLDAASCPDEPALRKAVAARFGYDPFFPWAKQTVIVQVWRDGARYVARVQILDEQGLMRGTRELSSDEANCSELFDATALTIAIALDASAAVAPAPPPPPPQPPPAPPPPVEVSLPLARPVPPPDAVPVARSAQPRYDVGADAFAAAGFAPNAAVGLGAFIAARSQALSVEVQLRGDFSPPARVGPGSVDSMRWAFLAAPCAHFRFAFACPLGEFGLIEAWGLHVGSGTSNSTPFVVLGLRVGAEVRLSAHAYLRIYADGLVDLNRPEFQVDYQPWLAPPVAVALGAGIARVIP